MSLDLTKLNGAINEHSLSHEQLLQEYQLSQWALTWALIKLGGSLTITKEDMEEANKQGRIWYSQEPDDAGRLTTVVEFKELEQSRIVLPGALK